MEVLGAMASFIAIGQAIEAGPKAFQLLRRTINPSKELAELSSELERMEQYYQYIADIIKPRYNSSVTTNLLLHLPEPPYMKQLRLDMEDFSRQLRSLLDDCTPRTASGKKQVLRMKWMKQKNEIRRLRNDCVRLSQQLEAAMGPYTLLVQASTAHVTISILDLLKERRDLVKDVVGDAVESLKAVDSDTSDEPKQPGLLDTQHGQAFPKPETLEDLERSEPNLQSVYAMGRCTCCCHNHKLSHLEPRYQICWLGVFTLSITRGGQTSSSCPDCQCLPHPGRVQLRFRYPSIYRKRAIDAALNFGYSSQISVSLRPVSIIANDHEIWSALYQVDCANLRAAMSRFGFFVTDEGPGESILEFLFIRGIVFGYDDSRLIAQLVRQADNGDIKRSAAWLCLWTSRTANWLDSRNQHQLKQFSLSLDEGVADNPEWQVYDAIQEGSNLINFGCWSREDLVAFTNDLGEGFLHNASRNDNMAAAQYLLWLGTDVNTKSRRGETPLHLACRFGAKACVRLLLDHGCEVDAKNVWGCTPLMWAARCEVPQAHDIIVMLLRRDASATTVDKDGWSVLHCLAQSKIELDAAKKRYALLCDHGAEQLLNLPGNSESTPVTSAIFWHNSNLLKVYLEAGAQANLAIHGRSILHYAAAYGTLEVIEVLLHMSLSGLDIRSRSNAGYTALKEMEWRRRNKRNPDPGFGPFLLDKKTEEVFESLLRNVRDQAIAMEVKEVEDILEVLKRGQLSRVRDVLHELVAKKQEAGIDSEAETFRVIRIQVDMGMIEAAIESLEEFCEVQRERLNTSPFTERGTDIVRNNFKHVSEVGDDREGARKSDTVAARKLDYDTINAGNVTYDSREPGDSLKHGIYYDASRERSDTLSLGNGDYEIGKTKMPYHPNAKLSHLDAKKSS